MASRPVIEYLRAGIGGLLMGLANLVPGVSGGTMLLAAGVYPQFIDGIAEVTTFRFRWRTLILLAVIGGTAAVAIVAFAGLIKAAVVDSRWVMYSLFIGLTLGGVPVVWRMLGKLSPRALAGCALGIALMAVMAFAPAGVNETGGGPAYGRLFFAGAAGASAMILPGVSGAYLLLVLGQYLPILGAIDLAKTSLLGDAGPQWDGVIEAMHTFIPVGLGVVAGVVGISNLVKWLLARARVWLLGFLLGLLLGAVLGLWPFQQGVQPKVGDVVKGKVLTAADVADVEPDDYPLAPFDPTPLQGGAAFALIVVGFGVTQAIARLGGREETEPAA